MSENIAQLLEMARKCELKASEAYRHFADKFALIPKASHFWKTLSREESEHAEFVDYLLGRLPEDVRTESVDKTQRNPVEKLLEYMDVYPYQEVDTIGQAYQYTRKIEDYEVTSIVQLLSVTHMPTDARNEILHKQLSDHYCMIQSFVDGAELETSR